MLDDVQVIFWSITYILIIIAGFKSREIKRVSMPYAAGIVNLSWEFNALIQSHGMWGHVIWFGLDCIISFWAVCFLKGKRRMVYIILPMLNIPLFGYFFSLPRGMLSSSFLIDLLMAICFLIDFKKLSPYFKRSVAVTKFIGDTCAGIYYAQESRLVAICAVLVFVCNVVYLCRCMNQTDENKIRYESNLAE